MTRRTDKDVKLFYAQRGGAKMLTEPCPSRHVMDFFKQERAALETIFRKHPAYRGLLEIGCGQGRHLAWATNSGLHYHGVDLVPWLVQRARRSMAARIYSARCRLNVLSVNNIHKLLDAEKNALQPSASLAFFPFNCFGNLAQPRKSVAALAKCGIDSFVSNFRPAPIATLMRMHYYGQCGYTGLTQETTPSGSLVRSAEGLSSYAYEPAYMDSLFDSSGYRKPETFELGKLGIGYLYVHSTGVSAQQRKHG